MLLDIIIIIVGIAMVLWGADKMTEGAVAVAERFGISQIVIGLTVVACGTSMPELCVSLVSALKGTSDLAVGNVVGSNIFNTMLIVGVAAAITPITILRNTVKKDIPFALVASVVLTLMCLDHNIARWEAAILLCMFGFFMWMTLKGAKQENSSPASDSSSEGKKKPALGRAILLILIGIFCLIYGSNIFVDAAVDVATTLGVSEAVIGLTIVACGTSLPELATTVVAARKGNSGIAIGNVLGSNVFNILMILSVTGLITPMQINGITMLDLSVLTGSIFLLWYLSFTKLTIERWEGWLLSILFITYLSYLVWQVA
ncbi:MAG: calcium/sodium antiporter [Prevotella sp.]|nr:calcium/sodium antiporter [Prevotella sp.]